MKMKVTLLLVCALLAAAQGRSLLASDGKPDSPPYEVKNSTRSLEIREYEEGKSLCDATFSSVRGKQDPRPAGLGTARSVRLEGHLIGVLTFVIKKCMFDLSSKVLDVIDMLTFIVQQPGRWDLGEVAGSSILLLNLLGWYASCIGSLLSAFLLLQPAKGVS